VKNYLTENQRIISVEGKKVKKNEILLTFGMAKP
jgi:hypothetical protein